MATKRGINLGCGHVILPCDRPNHQKLIPEFLYTDPEIAWDNADWNASEGVSKVVDLFDYPWMLPDNAYDYAIASHIAEHIPHHIVERGKLVPRHEQYQDGWFYWFGELNRILKPGGKAFILCPYAWSNSGMSDPTHTRYITAATLNYLVPDAESPFIYRGRAGWKKLDYENDVRWTPHERGVKTVQETMQVLGKLNHVFTRGMASLDSVWNNGIPQDDEGLTLFFTMMWDLAQTSINAIADICVTMTKVSDADHS